MLLIIIKQTLKSYLVVISFIHEYVLRLLFEIILFREGISEKT